ncbi:hypothetical protein EJ06DRAFT_474922 [Trichodelitschia bisporula]|uniref:Transcriptional regulator Ngg1 n=1 Tax=Trichodelitschia bisporula TaxID=703511 RepID=A0A6G1I1C5_9PEZI|nr:hypothetical protein EJ06DRAFT_474922 [Trichodelitschia bisporula]
MPTPAPGKGKGKAARPQQQDVSAQAPRRSRSRNSTPVSASSTSHTVETNPPYITTSLTSGPVLSNSPVEDIFDAYSKAAGSPPSAGALRLITENVKSQLLGTVKPRIDTCERLIRELHMRRKERTERDRQRERMARDAEERRLTKARATPRKKDREEMARPLAVGAHGVARQDGVDLHKDTIKPGASPTSPMTPHQPPPAPTIPQYQIFGDDPTAFPDPTIYEIRPITPGMTEEEKKEILGVSSYPASNLHHLTPGIPPNRDFSNAKPMNQVNAQTFHNYVEPFIRPLTEEDRAFLLERGDRTKAFVMPKRGRHYKEVWAEEDGGMAVDFNLDKLPANVARGDGIEAMDDAAAETDELSAGPMVARLLATLRSDPFSTNTNDAVNGDAMDIDGETQPTPQPGDAKAEVPATAFPEATWKNAPPVPRQDYESLDDRVMAELRNMGFLGPSDTPDYDSGADDEVAARLRFLQEELRRVSIINGARKARVLEVADGWMAAQEYQTIADDLDNQLNQAYLKRNRNIGKKTKQVKRPGGAGGGSHPIGVARPGGHGVGEPIRNLMDRRDKWNGWIGPVVNYGKVGIPSETLFDDGTMKKLEAREQESWGEGEE